MIIAIPLVPSIRDYEEPSIQRVPFKKVEIRRMPPVRVVQIGAEHGGPQEVMRKSS